MKEITAVVRMNMVSQTTNALKEQGFPCFTCRKVVGRGRKKVDFTPNQWVPGTNDYTQQEVSDQHRLVPNRMFTVVVNDEDVDEVISTIIKINQTNNPGDGKIFVRNVDETIRVRTGEKDALAL